MTFLDLCAGIGGFSLGLEWAGMTCKGQVEIDDYCNRVLKKHWPHVPRWADLKTINPDELPSVDLIAGGYPCQPFSLCGERQGADDDRHLWPFIFKIVTHLRPSWCLFENVVGHVTVGLDHVLSDLEMGGYTAWPLILPACCVGAPHQRERVWIIAYSDKIRPEMCAIPQHGSYEAPHEQSIPAKASGYAALVQRIFGTPDCEHIRRGDGISHWLDRIGAIGNAVHPGVVFEIGRAIIAAHYGGA